MTALSGEAGAPPTGAPQATVPQTGAPQTAPQTDVPQASPPRIGLPQATASQATASQPPGEPTGTGYGPSALATPANALTVFRLLAAPLLVIVVLHRPTSWLTWAVWTVLAGTDGIDGWLARRHGTTRSGAFLDPLADKFLVLGAMFALVADHRFSVVPVVVIAIREVAISLYRSVVGRHGVSVPARGLAKVKTLVQAFAVGFMVWPVTGGHPSLAVALLWVAVVLTVVTGVQYLAEARKAGPVGTRDALGGASAVTGGPVESTAGTAPA